MSRNGAAPLRVWDTALLTACRTAAILPPNRPLWRDGIGLDAEGPDSVDSGEIEVTSLKGDPSHKPRRGRATGPRRLLLTCACALALAFAIVGLLASTQTTPHAALNALLGIPSPTPTATLEPSAGVFFIEHRVPWGVLTVDGKRNDALDITQMQGGSDPLDDPLSFALPRGRHQITYNAPPFTPLRCVISVPAAPHDTCPLAQPDDQTRRAIGSARILDLSATITNLPAQPKASLVAAATAAIGISTPGTTAGAGERYLGTDGQPHVFAHDTGVTLFREPWTGAPLFEQADCQFLCPMPEGSGPAPNVWSILAEVREGYHYSSLTPSGAAPADSPLAWTPGSLEQPQGPLVDTLELSVTWDSAWHVTLEEPNNLALACQAASTVLSNFATGSGPANTVPQFQPIVPAANQTDGCIVGIQMRKADGTPGATGALLYRFGVLLTTDTLSAAMFPQLPQANGAEQTLAQQTLAQPH